MTAVTPQRPAFPALFQTVPATAGKRVLRGAVSAVLVLGLGMAITAIVLQVSGRTDLTAPSVATLWAVTVAGLAVLVALIGAFAGGWLPDLVVGTRLVRVADGRIAVAAGLVRAVVLGALGAVTAGLAPLALTIFGRDANGRGWIDRVSGTVLIDVRSGRNVLRRPVTTGELDEVFRPVQAPRPAIIQVRPEQFGEPLRPGGPRPLTPPQTLVSERVGEALPSAAPAEPPTRIGSTQATAAAIPSQDPAGAVWLLSFDTGEQHLLHGTALIGRQPVAQQNHRGAELIKISDPSLTMSATHLAVIANEVGVWVEDLGSTNGSEVRAPNGRTQALAVRVRTPVSRGSRVRLGDRWMTVGRTQ
jgi:hypothetical protein